MLLRGFRSLLWMLLVFACSGCFFTKTGNSTRGIGAIYSGENAGAHFAHKVEKVYFDPGKYELKESSKRVLLELVEKIRKEKGVHITLVGHADAHESETCNAELSEQRANAVKQFIVGHDKSLAQRITTYAKGKSEPEVLVYSKDRREIEKAYTQNRRVVIVVEFANTKEKSAKKNKTN